METYRNKLRNLIGDNSSPDTFIDTYTTSKTFSLDSNAISVSDVFVNDEEIGASEFTFDSTTKKVTLNVSLNEGDVVQINFTGYPNYSNSELDAYLKSALIHISVSGYDTFVYDEDTNDIYPEPTDREENLICMIAAILINPDNKSIRLPDIAISAPSTPTNTDSSASGKIKQLIATFKNDSAGGIFDLI